MIKFFIKLIKSFLRNFEKVDDSYFETNFNLFKKAKSHVWTHAAMYLAWCGILALLIAILTYDGEITIVALLSAVVIFVIGIPSLIPLFIIENTFYPKYKLKRRFVYENPLFSVIWLIGELFVIFVTCYFLYILMVK